MNKEILEILKGIKKDLDIIASDKEAEKKAIYSNQYTSRMIQILARKVS